MSGMVLFSGNANPKLASQIADQLQTSLGEALVSKFSDGETRVEIKESVRGLDVFIIQSTCAPINDHLMEILLITDAVRRASANRVTAVIPYFGYARQDKRTRSARVPIAARLAADLLATAGIHRVLTVDLHADQIQGFFAMPVDNAYGSKVLIEDIVKQNYEKPVIVSPDVGGVVRARAFAKRLNHAELAIIDKRRPKPNESQVMNVIGDVQEKICIIVDDIVDTGGTLCHAAEGLKKKGATKVVSYCTHAVLSGNAVKMIENSAIDELVVTDTIPLTKEASHCKKIRTVSMASILAEAIRRVSGEESVSSMFN